MGRKGKTVVLDHTKLLRQTREMNSKIERDRKKTHLGLQTNITALQQTVASLTKEIKHYIDVVLVDAMAEFFAILRLARMWVNGNS